MTGRAAPRVYRAVVICNGDAPSPELLRREARAADLVVCADGGAEHAERVGARIDAVVGDLDSLPRPVAGVRTIDAGPHSHQDSSDSEKAVRYALECARAAAPGVGVEVRLLAAVGTRPDHSFANLLLCGAYRSEARVTLVCDDWEAEVLTGAHDLRLPLGRPVSLLPLGPAADVRTDGLRWDLDGPLCWGTRGVSNRPDRSPVHVEVRSGAVVLFRLREA